MPSLFFVTTTFKKWQPLLMTELTRDEFQNLLFSVVSTHASALMGFVIMPEHIHLLVGCAQGEKQLSKFIQTLKSLSTRRLFSGHGSVWMERYVYFTVTTEKQLITKLNYIHQNPVRRGLVNAPIDWQWSSASFWESEEKHAVLTKDWDWMTAYEGVRLDGS